MVRLILSHDDLNLTTDEIFKIKKLCDSFGIRPECTIDDSGINEQKIHFNFGYDIKRQDVFRRGLMRLIEHIDDRGDMIPNMRHKLPRLYYTRRTSCPWV